MKTLNVTDRNNLIIKDGNITLAEDSEALAQSIKTRIGMCVRENPFNQKEGIDFDNDFLGKYAGQNYYKNAIRNRIMERPEGINGIYDIRFRRERDTAILEIDVDSIYGVMRI